MTALAEGSLHNPQDRLAVGEGKRVPDEKRSQRLTLGVHKPCELAGHEEFVGGFTTPLDQAAIGQMRLHLQADLDGGPIAGTALEARLVLARGHQVG